MTKTGRRLQSFAQWYQTLSCPPYRTSLTKLTLDPSTLFLPLSLPPLSPSPSSPPSLLSPLLSLLLSTGPVLAFTLVLYRTAQRLGLNFLPL